MSDHVALVFTDVVDSTHLAEQLGDAVMGPLWAAHDQVSRELIDRWRGTEVGRSDGFLVLFAGVSDAVGFAHAYHAALATFSVPMKARVGIHVGPVTLRENAPADKARGATPFEVDGLALPAAARVMSVAQGGQTLLSAAAAQALGESAWRVASQGHWRLKGLHDPIELFAIGQPGAAFTPPADSAKAYRVVWAGDAWTPVREIAHSLPAERNSFVGREAVLRLLADDFDRGARLVTLLGLGGIGKTRLAQRYARLWLGEFPGGVWFSDLAPATSADGIVNAVAQGLNVPLGRADPVQQLGAAIAGRGACLVILDNFEQVVDQAEATLGAWLERAPQARFIVTSRAVLGVVGEQVLLVPPLDAEDAVAMFRQRVQAVGVKSAFGADDEAALSPLMELLDRLPLAIELAAARARLMTPRRLLQRMADRFKLLATRGGRHDRQATMRATLDWSWALLSPAEQSALAQLSVFARSFTLDAAEAVVDLSPFRFAPEKINVLQALVEKSLLRQGSAGRFELLVTVQDYASERCTELAERADAGHSTVGGAVSRHAEHHATLHTRSSAAALCADLDNLVLAARRAAAAGAGDVAVGALQGAWAAFKLRGPFRAVIELAQQVRATSGLSVAAAARADWIWGWALKSCGRVDEAQARFLVALDGARHVADRACEGHVLCHLGDLYRNAGRLEESRSALLASLETARTIGDTTLECEACSGLGNLQWGIGRLDEARAHHEAALEAALRAGDSRWAGGCLGNLGVMALDMGRPDEAEDFFERALAIARDLGDRPWEGNTRSNLGLLHHLQGRYSAAIAELEIALRAARELGHVRLECVVLVNLGMAVEAAHSPDVALGHYEAALRVARGLGDRRGEGLVLGCLGVLHARQGRFAEGRACLRDGFTVHEAFADRLGLAQLHCSRAECEHLAGDADAAARAWRAAQAITDEFDTEIGAELRGALARVRGLIGAASVQV